MDIKAMRSVMEVSVNNFLVAEIPFLYRHAWCMQAYVRLSEAETHRRNKIKLNQILKRSRPDKSGQLRLDPFLISFRRTN